MKVSYRACLIIDQKVRIIQTSTHWNCIPINKYDLPSLFNKKKIGYVSHRINTVTDPIRFSIYVQHWTGLVAGHKINLLHLTTVE